MNRHDTQTNRVALLATGDEISEGDVLNTNAREIARLLSADGITPGMHMTVSDHINEIMEAIQYLLSRHRGLIITGGLGPTSDDLTRYALSKAIQHPLVFHEAAWDDIVNRLQRLGHATPPDSNRQQALFPEKAILIPNASGTAAGCMLAIDDKRIFMLPGPPNECLPMVKQVVLPALEQADFRVIRFRQSWLLFGVSEGKIAERLDSLVASSRCTTGYRLAYPYVEFKLLSDHEADFLAVLPLIEKEVAPFLTENGQEMASALLRQRLHLQPRPLRLCDEATGGTLEQTIKTPSTYPFLEFVAANNAPDIIIQGLDAFWQGIDAPFTELHLRYPKAGHLACDASIPLRGIKTRLYATEFICRELLRSLPLPTSTPGATSY